MSGSEPRRVTDARPGPPAHPLPPWWYGVWLTVLVVAVAGTPLWNSVLPPRARAVAACVPVVLAVVLGAIELRRRSRGEARPPRIRDFPSVPRAGVPLLLVAGLVGIAVAVSVHHGHRGVAFALVVLVAVLTAAGALFVSRAMRTDVETGRVRMTPRPPATTVDRRTVRHAPGDRVVWLGSVGGFDAGARLVYSGTFVADGPAPWVTIRHDGAPGDARVKPERLVRESDYMTLVETRGAPPPTAWG